MKTLFRSLNVFLAQAATALAIAAPVLADPIVFEDQLGKTIELAEPAKRVIVLTNPAPGMLVAVAGGVGPLIGMNSKAKSAIMGNLLGKLYPEIADIDTGIVGDGFVPNIESMLAADPDVVIQWAYRLDEIVEPMERVGLTVMGFSWGTYEIEAEQIAMLGKILGKEERATEILKWHRGVYDSVAAAVAPITHEDRQRILFLSNFEGDLAAWGRDELLFQVPGLRNVVFEAGIEKGTAIIDAEQILAWDPDIIFINFFNQVTVPQDIYDDPRFAGLSAVKNRRIYKTPTLTSNSNETPMLWAWMASVAYPDKYSLNHRQEIAIQIEAQYGRRPDPADIDALLQVEANSVSADYEAIIGQ